MASSAHAESRAGSPQLVLAHLDALAVLAPAVAALLRDPASDANTERDEIAILRSDGFLASRIRLLAESSLEPRADEDAGLESLVARLGVKACRNLIVCLKTVACFPFTEQRPEQDGFDAADFWRHALAVACAARDLCAENPELQSDPDDAFISGWLHDLGKIALHAAFPKAYDRVISCAHKGHSDIAACEASLFGIDHLMAGRHVAARWHLPRKYVEAVWLHHISVASLPTRVEAPRLIALVQLADTLVREQRIGFSGNQAFYESSANLARLIGLAPPRVDCVAARLGDEVKTHSRLLGLDGAEPGALYSRVLSRTNSDLGQANGKLVARNDRLACAARLFYARTRFDSAVSEAAGPSDVVRAMAHAACDAFHCRGALALAIHAGKSAVEIAWIEPGADECRSRAERVDDKLKRCLETVEPGGPVLRPIPAPLRHLIAGEAAPTPNEGRFAAVFHAGQLAGGLILKAGEQYTTSASVESDEIRSFLSGLGLAIGRANVLSESRRLSDDLAETNRRLQETQSDALRARTFGMIAEMAAGAGHELNSPLFVISGRAELLQASIDDPDAHRSLMLIHDKALECSRIVSDLMEFARPHPPKLAPVEIAPLLEELRRDWLKHADLPASRLRVRVDTEHLADSRRLSVLADAEQLHTVLDELIRNAVEAVRQREGSIQLESRVCGPQESPMLRSPSSLPSERETRWIEIRVCDRGCGMAPAVSQRVFEPFYSFRPAGRGRGLGLARAYRIIEAHGGRIWLDSRPNHGTEVSVVLPTASAPASE